jgi:hypothetical protein
MTTINNVRLNELVREIHRAASRLDYLMREGQEHELFLELYRIHNASEDAQWVINDIDLARKRKVAA